MPFSDLPVDIILYLAEFLTDGSIASLILTNKSFASLLLPCLYNRTLRSPRSSISTMRLWRGYEPQWTAYIGKWHSPMLLNYFRETSAQNLQYDPNKTSLLHLAAREGNSDLAEILLRKGFDVNVRGGHEKETPLLWALISKQEATANLLLDAGAVVMPQTGHILLYATQNCSCAMVKRIVEKIDELGESRARLTGFPRLDFPRLRDAQFAKNLALAAARALEEPDKIDVLLDHGADPEWKAPLDMRVHTYIRYVFLKENFYGA